MDSAPDPLWWKAVLTAATPRPDGTLETILDGAGRVFARSGITRVRLPWVAREAGLSGVVLRRYASGKSSLLERYLLREIARLFTEVFSRHDLTEVKPATVTELLAEIWLETWKHPVAGRVLEHEWDAALLLAAHSHDGPPADLIRVVLQAFYDRAGLSDPVFRADLAIRVFLSLLLLPPAPRPVTVEPLLPYFAAAVSAEALPDARR